VSGVSSLILPRSLVVVGASPRNVAAVETVVASGVTAWWVNPNRGRLRGSFGRRHPRVRRTRRRGRRRCGRQAEGGAARARELGAALLGPNCMGCFVPNVSLERYNPDGVFRTVEVTDYYFGTDVSTAEIEELMAWDNQVAEEDVSLVQSVQRGLDSGAVPQGRLMGESEKLIADFQRRIHAALLG
jgi:Ring hydroxylating alpha subunit (catalytic domain)